MGKKKRQGSVLLSKAMEIRYAWHVGLVGVKQAFLVIAPDAERAASGARKAAREMIGVHYDAADIESLKRIGPIDAEVV